MGPDRRPISLIKLALQPPRLRWPDFSLFITSPPRSLPVPLATPAEANSILFLLDSNLTLTFPRNNRFKQNSTIVNNRF